jgi:Trypsin-like peptidase domain
LNFPGADYVGTGWFVDRGIVITNRHVASLIARWDGRQFVFARGVGGKAIRPAVSTLHEFDDLVTDTARIFAVTEVLYIEPDDGPDIAFLRVARRTDGTKLDRIPVARTDVAAEVPVFVVGYPARAPRSVIPDQQRMKELYRDRFDVKRAAPGFTMPEQEGTTRHDCTTLGGNSGSVVLDMKTGEAVGLHFAGLYQETNYAVRASVLTDYINKKRWLRPPRIRSEDATPKPAPKVPDHSAMPHSAAAASAYDAEVAAKAFWRARPVGVIAVRVGFHEEGDAIGDRPFVAAAVKADELDAVQARGPTEFEGYEVNYVPATLDEQLAAMPQIESVDRIAYDDNARKDAKFSFDLVEEEMTVRAHVGPEYSWDELNSFLSGAKRSLASAIYEFHGTEIKDTLERRLKAGVSLTLVMDNATFSELKDESMEFDRIPVFDSWKRRFKTRFERIVVPEGTRGLISDAYHIKVTVREDDTFWLSSGNWKQETSQPVITQNERDNAERADLPGNREWHVIIKNATLAQRFRNHILQDLKRSKELGGTDLPKSKEALDILVDIQVDEEAVILERRPPSALVEPENFDGTIKVKPLLTPDREGKVYSEAVLELIRSAQHSLLFQIPYIGMPSNPTDDRGYIDALIAELNDKLKTLEDARVILRAPDNLASARTTIAACVIQPIHKAPLERLKQLPKLITKFHICSSDSSASLTSPCLRSDRTFRMRLPRSYDRAATHPMRQTCADSSCRGGGRLPREKWGQSPRKSFGISMRRGSA